VVKAGGRENVLIFHVLMKEYERRIIFGGISVVIFSPQKIIGKFSTQIW
jgi:hypothetical protein